VRDPVGMSGVRLEAKVHIVTAAATSAQNIIKCANRCGLHVNDIVIEQLASAESVLSQDEKDLGVALVDIGGGTTDIIIYVQGAIRHTSVIAVGGNHLTNDIAIGIRTPTLEAERIKHEHGCATSQLLRNDEMIEVPSVGGRKPRTISRYLLGEIIEPRVEEIFQLVRREIEKMGFLQLLGSGIVLTGGSSLLPGMVEVAERVFELPARNGVPQGFGGLVDVVSSPVYSTAVGLVLYGNKQEVSSLGVRSRAREINVYSKVRSRMKEWFHEFF